MCVITNENHVRFWPDRRRWHLWVSFPFLEASSSVSSFPSLAWCWQLSSSESLDSVMDRYDDGVFEDVPLLQALCRETWSSYVVLLRCSPLP